MVSFRALFDGTLNKIWAGRIFEAGEALLLTHDAVLAYELKGFLISRLKDVFNGHILKHALFVENFATASWAALDLGDAVADGSLAHEAYLLILWQHDASAFLALILVPFDILGELLLLSF